MTCPAPLELAPPRKQNHLPVKWKVFVIDGVGYAGLDAENYKNLSLNNGEINRWEAEIVGQVKEYLDQKQTIIRVEPNDN